MIYTIEGCLISLYKIIWSLNKFLFLRIQVAAPQARFDVTYQCSILIDQYRLVTGIIATSLVENTVKASVLHGSPKKNGTIPIPRVSDSRIDDDMQQVYSAY